MKRESLCNRGGWLEAGVTNATKPEISAETLQKEATKNMTQPIIYV